MAWVLDESEYSIEQVAGFRSIVRGMIGGAANEEQGEFSVHKNRLGSVEVMGQHLWRGDHGILNTKPAWRLTFLGIGPALDAGELPVADFESFAESDEPNPGWLRGFKVVNYLAYGVRFNQGTDEFSWGAYIDGVDGWGRTFANTEVRNSLLGPQLAMGRIVSKGRWVFDASGMILLGYQETKTALEGGFGDNIITGGLNNPAVAQPTYTLQTQREDHFGTHAEVRLTTSYLIRKHWSLDAMIRGFMTGPWYDASERFGYTLPNYTLQPAPAKALVGANLFLGVTYLR